MNGLYDLSIDLAKETHLSSGVSTLPHLNDNELWEYVLHQVNN